MPSSPSGRLWASQSAKGAKFSKIGAHTGSSRLFLSKAKPMVGVCEAAMPPMIRAIPVLLQKLIWTADATNSGRGCRSAAQALSLRRFLLADRRCGRLGIQRYELQGFTESKGKP